jgi:hypothetical protein
MKGNPEIAAAIDLRVRQLAVHRLSDSALVDHMVGYMADLQCLWTSTSDEELAELCDAYPGFMRYATLMENMSEAMRTGVGVPAHVKQLSPLAEPLKRAMNELLTHGADLERSFQQRIDESRASRFQTKAVQVPAYDTADLDGLYIKWCAAVEQLIADVGASDGSDQVQQLLRQAFKDMSNRIDRLHKNS